MRKNNEQQGSAVVVVLSVIVVVLIAVLGWVFWQNAVNKKSDDKVATTSTQKTADNPKSATQTSSSEVLKYVDFRKDDKDVTGVVLATDADVAKLDGASQKLKDFFVAEIHKPYHVMDFETGQTKTVTTKKFTIDRIYGDYAVGSYEGGPAYFAYGPKDGTGDITDVAGTQNDGFVCDKLENAKVPSQLVDSRCIASDGGGEKSYSN